MRGILADLLMAGVGVPKNNPDAQYNGAQFDQTTNTFKLPNGTVIDTNDPRYDNLIKGLNANGQVNESLVNQPNFWQRAFNPEASAEAVRMNQQFAAAPTIAQQANTTQRGIIAGNLRPLPQDSLPYGGNQEANITAAQQGGYSPQDILAQKTATMESQGGLPAAQALAQTTAAQRAGLYGQAALDFGLPRTEAATETTGQQLQGGRNVYGLQNLPTETLAYGLQRGNELTQALNTQAVLPYTGRSALAGAATEAALREQAERLLPYSETIQAGEAMKGALGAQHLAPTEPFDIPINTQTGTYGNIARSPLGMLPQLQAMAAMQGGLQMPGAAQTLTLPSGKVVTFAKPQNSENSILPNNNETPEERKKREQQAQQPTSTIPSIQELRQKQGKRPTRATVAGDTLKNMLREGVYDYNPLTRGTVAAYRKGLVPAYNWFFNNPYGQ